MNTHLANIFKTRNGLMLLWLTDLMNVTEEVNIQRPSVPTLLRLHSLNLYTRVTSNHV